MKQNNIIIGIRNMASLDHIYPIIPILIESGFNVKTIITDVRFFLQKSTRNVKIDNYFTEKYTRKLKIIYSMLKFCRSLLDCCHIVLLQSLIYRSIGVLYNKILIRNTIEIIKDQKVILIIIDHANNDFLNVIAHGKSVNNYRIIAFPHGMNFFRNVLLNRDEVDIIKKETSNHFLNGLDTVIVNHMNHKNYFMKTGVCEQKIRILPSIRFNKYNLEFKDLQTKSNNKGLKVLFIVPKSVSNIFEHELKTTIDLLKSIFGKDLFLQFHPTVIRNNKRSSGLYNTNDLINKSHLVLFVDSSVVVQAIVQKKACILLNHLHNNDQEFADLDIMDITNTRDDFINTIKTFYKDPTRYLIDYQKKYSKNIDLFITNNQLNWTMSDIKKEYLEKLALNTSDNIYS
jgi:hypothetical protein